jgi:hypothetical protein
MRQQAPLAPAGLRLLTDHIPFALLGQLHRHGDDLPAGAGLACGAAIAAAAYSQFTDIHVVFILFVVLYLFKKRCGLPWFIAIAALRRKDTQILSINGKICRI